MIDTPQTLGDIVSNISAYSKGDDLYTQHLGGWSADSICAILTTDEYSDEPPAVAVENHLVYAMQLDTLEDIIKNAKDQGLKSISNLVEAVNFYFENDAFITVS